MDFTSSSKSHTDHVIDLNFATGTDTQTALDAGIQIHAHRNMAIV